MLPRPRRVYCHRRGALPRPVGEMCTEVLKIHTPCAQAVCTSVPKMRTRVHQCAQDVHKRAHPKLPGNFSKLPGNFPKLPGNFDRVTWCTLVHILCTLMRTRAHLVHTCAHGACLCRALVHISTPSTVACLPPLWQHALPGSGSELATA